MRTSPLACHRCLGFFSRHRWRSASILGFRFAGNSVKSGSHFKTDARISEMRLRGKHMEAPLVLEAQWFWRVTLAIPDAPFERRVKITAMLVLLSMAEQPQTENLNVLQWILTYQTWRSEADRMAYLDAAKGGRIRTEFSSSASVGLEEALSLLGHSFRTPDLEITTF